MKHHPLITASLIAITLSAAPFSWAHVGHAAAPGENTGPATGPITLSDEAEKNIGLMVEEAGIRTLEKILSTLGHVELDPARVVALSSRISGKVTRLSANEGDRVTKGDFLFEIESLQIGDPPPRIEFRSPITGTVIDRRIFVGDNISPDSQLLKVADLSSLFVIARIYEGQISQVKPGQKVRLRAEAYPDQMFEGTTEGHTAQLDPVSRTLGVRIRVTNTDGRLLPNMRASLHIVTAEADSVIAVSHSAVLGDSGNLFVFIQDDTNPHLYTRTAVVVGQRDDRFVEIIEGVLPGAKVVTIGNYQLQYVLPTTAKSAADDH